MFSNKSLLIYLCAGLALGFVLGFFTAFVFQQASPFQAGTVKNLVPPISPSEMTTIMGTVKEINGKIITVEMAESPNPADKWPTKRRVIVDSKTKILKISAKSPAELKKEIDSHPKDSSGLTFLPNGVKEEEIELSDIRIGDSINVSADHNIKTEVKFIATRITLNASQAVARPPLGGVTPPVGP